jgi:hypothetical protein
MKCLKDPLPLQAGVKRQLQQTNTLPLGWNDRVVALFYAAFCSTNPIRSPWPRP